MRSLYFIPFIILFLNSCSNKPIILDNPDSGIPLILAEHRAKQVSDVTYALSFKIPESQQDPIISKLVLTLTLQNIDAPLYLDFKEETNHLKKIIANGSNTTILHKNEHIKIEQEYLKKGLNTIEIDFLAGELSLNRNKEFLYTLLVPDRARTLFPCFDQPNIKAKYALEVTAPKGWKVLCAAPIAKQEENNGFVHHQFGLSDKMSTYLFSFVAGKFESDSQNLDNFSMNMLYRETNAEKITFSNDSIFQLHQQSISFLEDYTKHPFPFQKFDFATIPGFQYGGMEHVGAIQYRESSLFLDESATENTKLRRAKLIAHETAHMWFGDLVTMNWFNDVWMKEVFANFMADKIVNPAFPKVNHDLAFMTLHYPRAYSEDRTKGTNPIRQKLDNLNNAGSLYGSIIYNKAPIMMRQLESVMGKQAFKKGVQEYINTYQNSNAVWNDLISILDKNTAVDIANWSEVWVNNSSRPIFEETITYDANNTISSFEISQKAEDNNTNIWPQSFDVTFIYEDHTEILNAVITTEKIELSKAKGLSKPKAIIYNSNGMGYGVFPINESALQESKEIAREIARGYTYTNAYENTLLGNIKPKIILDYYAERLKTEENELLVNLTAGYLRAIFWKYLTPEERMQNQQVLADNLWTQLHTNIPANIKKTIFTTFRSIAYSDISKEQLYKVWNKDIQIPNLKLNEDDYTGMAMDLALYRHKDVEKIVVEAESAISNPDKLERFKFILPSLSKDINVKNSFFESLKEEKNRTKEAWVANAVNYLNHPLYAKEALNYVRPSLDLLDEIQKTGDIFFPKRWLSNTVGNHTSSETYTILQEFLKDNPDLNPALTKKLWQAADDLRRIQLLHDE